MSPKSAFTLKVVCGVSILALSGTGSFTMDTAEAAQANKKFSLAQTFKARGMKATNSNKRISPRGTSRFTVKKRTLSPKTVANDRRFIKSKAGHRILNTRRPVIGNHRLSLGSVDAGRAKQLAKGMRERRFGRIVNISSAGTSTKRTANVARKEAPLSPTAERTRRIKAHSQSSKSPYIKYELKNAMVTSYQVSGSADDRPTNRKTGSDIKFEGKSVVRHSDTTVGAEPSRAAAAALRWTGSWSAIANSGPRDNGKSHDWVNMFLNDKPVPRTGAAEKDEGGRHTPWFGNYRPQFFFRAIEESAAASGEYVPSIDMMPGTGFQAPPPSGGACYPEGDVCEPPEPGPNCSNC